MKEWSRYALEKAREDVIELEDEGHDVMRYTDYHWVIDGEIDVWPSTKKYKKRNGKVETYRTSIREVLG